MGKKLARVDNWTPARVVLLTRGMPGLQTPRAPIKIPRVGKGSGILDQYGVSSGVLDQ